MSPLARDPRVLREIDWLLSDDWTVDTLGMGPIPNPRVREHFETGEPPAWTGSRVAKGLIHTLLPYRTRFRILLASLIPPRLAARRGAYDLIVVNDVDLVPWMVDMGPCLLTANGRMHLDLHEWYPAEPGPPADLTARLIRGYQAWVTDQLASPAFASRSTVSPGLGDLYVERYGVPAPVIIRSAPAYEEMVPSPVDPDAIELAYHGNADLTRGLGLFAGALALLEPRFRLNLMLTGPEDERQALRDLLAPHASRVRYHDPVPVTGIAQRINEWDLEIIFFPPIRTNLLYTLPNKFFEAVQGRLGVVAGENVDLAAAVREHGVGTVVPGWTAADLAAGINSLTVDDIVAMKAATREAARALSAERERDRFLELFTAAG